MVINRTFLLVLGGLDLTSRHWWIIATVLLLAAAVGVGVPIALKITAGAPFDERLEVASRLLQVFIIHGTCQLHLIFVHRKHH